MLNEQALTAQRPSVTRAPFTCACWRGLRRGICMSFIMFSHLDLLFCCRCWGECRVVTFSSDSDWHRSDFAMKYSLTATLPITWTYCILILSKLISHHFKGCKLKVVLKGCRAVMHTHTHTPTHTCNVFLTWTRWEPRFEDFLFVFHGCAPLTLLEGNAFVLTTQSSYVGKRQKHCAVRNEQQSKKALLAMRIL